MATKIPCTALNGRLPFRRCRLLVVFPAKPGILPVVVKDWRQSGIPLLTVGGVLLVAGCGEPAPPAYELHFDRPHQPGLRYLQSTTGTEQRHFEFVRAQQSTNLHQSISFSFEAEVEVLAADERQLPARLRSRVRRLERVEAGATNLLVPAGNVFTFERDARGRMQVDEGSALAREARRLLILFAQIPDKTVSDGRVFKPSRPKPVGATWPMHAELLASALYSSERGMNFNQATGTVELVSLTNRPGGTALETRAIFESEVSDLKIAENLPPLMGRARLEFLQFLPTNAVPLPADEAQSMSITVAFSTNLMNRIPISVKGNMELRSRTILTPLP